MATDHIRYDLLTQDAMRDVMRTVLSDAARNGLPGEHHFFVTFATRAPGVSISPRLIAQYPEVMTIVLQHQFWDLAVNGDVLEVGLSFNGVRERLIIPFAAIQGFFDPSVKFGLQFADVAAEPAANRPEAAGPPTLAHSAEPTPLPTQAVRAEPAAPGAGAEVVRLDRFRKK